MILKAVDVEASHITEQRLCQFSARDASVTVTRETVSETACPSGCSLFTLCLGIFGYRRAALASPLPWNLLALERRGQLSIFVPSWALFWKYHWCLSFKKMRTIHAECDTGRDYHDIQLSACLWREFKIHTGTTQHLPSPLWLLLAQAEAHFSSGPRGFVLKSSFSVSKSAMWIMLCDGIHF